MLNKYCDLCGTTLSSEEYLYEIRDARDPYFKYHCKHWHVCDTCMEELDARRKKVIEDIESDSSICNCKNENMIEF